MISSKIAQRLTLIKAYDSSGTQTIIKETYARKAIDLLDQDLLTNPNTTYGDYQCGSGTLLIYLAERLMVSLVDAIPNETKRFKHIFQKQLFASDINPVQVLKCKANFKRILNDKLFKVNVEQKDFNNIDEVTDVIISSIEFTTTNEFLKKFKPSCKNILILTRPNKNKYTREKYIKEITKYRFLGVAGVKGHSRKTALICAMYFTHDQSDNVTFISDETSIAVNNPKFLPGSTDLRSFQYSTEILNQNFESLGEATYGSYYANANNVVNNPGDVKLIYQVGRKDQIFGKTISVSKDIITAKEGVGIHKMVISKNGNQRTISTVKYADPSYGCGHNALYVQGKSKSEVLKKIKHYNSPEIGAHILALNGTCPANGKSFWDKIPHYKYYNQVKEIYAKYYS